MSLAAVLERQFRIRRVDGHDLKWMLVRRIVGVAILCLAGGVLLVLRDVDREAAALNREAASTVANQLSLQLTRIDAALDRLDRFPDWQAIANFAVAPGQCVQYVPKARDSPRATCQGVNMQAQVSPDWFVKVYEFLPVQSVVELPLLHKGTVQGIVISTIEASAIADRAWVELSRLIWIAVTMILAMCLFVYMAIDRSLRPTTEILSGLNRLAEGNLAHRLPHFKLKELNRIAEVFNDLAHRLEVTTHERSELARKLVNAQEQERRHIARELHDDVAQRLSALNGLATSIKRACLASAPGVARQSEELVALTSGTMRSLRETLSHLRPPEIDDLGLVAGLQTLVHGYSRRANGGTTFTFAAVGEFDDLPGEMAAHAYRIVQEGLNNAARHANAKNVLVSLENAVESSSRMHRIEIAVVDDGSATPPVRRESENGIGLIGIRERVQALSGTVAIGQRKPHGFELRVSFPVRGGGEDAA